MTADMRDLDAGLIVGGSKSLLIDYPVREETLAVTNATQLETFKSLWLELVSQNEFGATAADIACWEGCPSLRR